MAQRMPGSPRVSSQTNAETRRGPTRGIRGAAVDLALPSSVLLVIAITGHPSLGVAALLACLTLIARLIASMIARWWRAIASRDEPRNARSVPRLRRGL